MNGIKTLIRGECSDTKKKGQYSISINHSNSRSNLSNHTINLKQYKISKKIQYSYKGIALNPIEQKLALSLNHLISSLSLSHKKINKKARKSS